jgi:hypothetical protein
MPSINVSVFERFRVNGGLLASRSSFDRRDIGF